MGQCENAAAYRVVFLGDREGSEALSVLKEFVGQRIQNPDKLVFHSKRGSPMRETNVLHEALHPALKALGFPKAGFHAFRRGCNRRWELAAVNPAVLREMGHSSETMTIPLAQVQAAFFCLNGPEIVVSENRKTSQVV